MAGRAGTLEHIGVAATHTHTGPSYADELRQYVEADEAGELTDELSDGYVSRLIEQAAEAAIHANERIGPVAIELVRAEVSSVSFDRELSASVQNFGLLRKIRGYLWGGFAPDGPHFFSFKPPQPRVRAV